MRGVLPVLVCGALLGGLVLATSLASVSVAANESISVTVPPSRVGDDAMYARFTREPSDGPGSPTGSWTHAGTKRIWVEAATRVEDRYAQRRDALIVHEDVTNEASRRHYVDRMTGSSIRTVDSYGYDDGWLHTNVHFHGADDVRFFPHQGATYEVGDPVALYPERCLDINKVDIRLNGNGQAVKGVGPANREAVLRVYREDCSRTWVPFFGPVDVKAATAWVERSGRVHERPAVNVRSVSTFVVTEDSYGHLVDDPIIGATVRRVHDQWFAADIPYPVLEQDEFFLERPGATTVLYARQFALGTFARGTDPAPAPQQPSATTLERTVGDLHHPADGAGSRLPYPLAQALQDLQHPTAPASWSTWNALNPGANLVAARLTHGDHATEARPSHRWSLIFATPAGVGRELALERFADVPNALARDIGDKPTPAYDVDQLRKRQITLAAAEELWRTLNGASDPDTPDFVHWGLIPTHFAASPACTAAGYGQIRGYLDPARELHTLYIGRSTSGACVNAPAEHKASILVVDAEHAELLLFVQSQGEFRSGPPPIVAMESADARPDAPSRSAVSPPDVRVAAVATMSLLALLLFAYFLPVLKVAATNAAYVLGYARLRKEVVLENRVRDQIVEIVKHDPGISMTDLSRRVGAGWGTVVHHVAILEKHALLASQVEGRHRRVFPVGLVDHSQQGRLAVLKNERPRRLFELIRAAPGTIQDQLARRIGVTPSATYRYLKRLEEVGLVEKVRDGRHVRYYPRADRDPPAAGSA